MKYIPVRYLDRLIRLGRRLDMIRSAIQDIDPEVSDILIDVEERLHNAIQSIASLDAEQVKARSAETFQRRMRDDP